MPLSRITVAADLDDVVAVVLDGEAGLHGVVGLYGVAVRVGLKGLQARRDRAGVCTVSSKQEFRRGATVSI
jgi:hypothetical protein